jgi:hypothetical protein
MTATVPFLQQSSGNKKTLKKHSKNTTISHQNGGGEDNWLMENGADVSGLTGAGSAQDEAMRVERRAHKRGGGDNECHR